MLVMYALSEVQVSWKQLLSSLGFEEQGSKIQKTTSDKKTRFQQEREAHQRAQQRYKKLLLYQERLDRARESSFYNRKKKLSRNLNSLLQNRILWVVIEFIPGG
jgi:TATA-binding protein-associated factor Taf7